MAVPVISTLRYDMPFMLAVDASDTGVGAVLQDNSDGVVHPVYLYLIACFESEICDI